MASIIKQYNGKVIKNAGDCLIYYFPKTVDIINSSNSNNDKNLILILQQRQRQRQPLLHLLLHLLNIINITIT